MYIVRLVVHIYSSLIQTPTIPKVGVWVHDESHGQDFGAHLHCVDTREDGLQFLLHMMVGMVMMIMMR